MANKDYRNWYNKKAWIRRSQLQLKMEPLCRMCFEFKPSRIVAAEVADHVIPHRGDPTLFWFGALQSLCREHHNRSKQQIETRGFSDEIGNDGFPVDPNHPFNQTG